MTRTTRGAARRARQQLLPRLGPLPGPVRRVLGSSLVAGLTTPHGPSRYLEAVHPLWSLEGGRALVTEVRAETPDTVTFTLRPDHGWSGGRAGQHVRIGAEIDGVLHTRTYSVSSSEHRRDGQLTITVKRKDGGFVSGHLTREVRPGSVLACSGATGDVVLPDPRPERLLLISGGSGITPMAAMLRTLADERHRGRVTFLHYARSRDEVAFAADLERIGAQLPDAEVVVVVTQTTTTDTAAADTADTTTAGTTADTEILAAPRTVAGTAATTVADVPGRDLTGRFTPDHLETLVPDHLEVPTFVCGPTGLVDAVEAHYEANAAAASLSVERFTPPALLTTSGPGEGTVRFAASGLERPDDGRSLLDQAESEGLTPEFGCRMGICRTCTQPKIAGGTVDLRNGRRSDAADEPVQLCVSVAAGDVVLDL